MTFVSTGSGVDGCGEVEVDEEEDSALLSEVLSPSSVVTSL